MERGERRWIEGGDRIERGERLFTWSGETYP